MNILLANILVLLKYAFMFTSNISFWTLEKKTTLLTNYFSFLIKLVLSFKLFELNSHISMPHFIAIITSFYGALAWGRQSFNMENDIKLMTSQSITALCLWSKFSRFAPIFSIKNVEVKMKVFKGLGNFRITVLRVSTLSPGRSAPPSAKGKFNSFIHRKLRQ